CYGRGGKEATLTDAFLVSGFLDPDRFLGGRMRLDRSLAEAAIARFADRLGMTADEAAESIVRVAVSTMYAEFTKILSRAAVDPRAFALVAFGGAGPVVGALVAREVGIPAVFVPRAPGTLCALGALSADIVNDAVRTVHTRVETELSEAAALRRQYEDLRAEVVNLRVQLRAERPRVPITEISAGAATPTARTTRRIWLDGRPTEARVFDRAALGCGARLEGPAIVEQPDTTVLVPGAHLGEVDRFGNLLLRREG